MATGYAPVGRTIQVDIANGGTTPSAGLDIQGVVPTALILPASLTSTAVTFQVSMDGSTYVALTKDDGTAYSVTIAASKAAAFDMTKMAAGWNYIKPVLGSSEGAARTLYLVVRPV